jgi:hypothetical protein
MCLANHVGQCPKTGGQLLLILGQTGGMFQEPDHRALIEMLQLFFLTQGVGQRSLSRCSYPWVLLVPRLAQRMSVWVPGCNAPECKVPGPCSEA